MSTNGIAHRHFSEEPCVTRNVGNMATYAEEFARRGAEQASKALRNRLNAYFRKWEKEHGMRPGAGALLVPAGWRPHR